MASANEIVAFKGKQSYLEVTLDETASFTRLKSKIIQKLNAGGQFFVGARKVIIVGTLNEKEKSELRVLFTEEFAFSEVIFRDLPKIQEEGRPQAGVLHKLSDAPVKRLPGKISAFPEHIPTQNSESSVSRKAVRETKTVFIRNTVRNGQRVAYDGSIVVLADVNRGAQLIATGDIIVMGALRGSAHAGSAGDESATVTAVVFSPQQLRISDLLAIAPENDAKMHYPEVACISEGKIQVMPLAKNKMAEW